MSNFTEFFGFPRIKFIIEEFLYSRGASKSMRKPFRAYVKESIGESFVVSDSYYEVACKLTPACKSFIKENYPLCFE